MREFPDSLFGVAAFDAGNAVAVGYHGAIKVSADAGASWSRVAFDSTELLRRVAALDGGIAYAVGHQGSIFGSRDFGRTWRSLHGEPGLYLRAIAFASPSAGWAVGHEGTILKTADGGATWARQKIADYKGRDLPRLSGIAAISESQAIAVGEFGVVAETRDGGANWNLLSYKKFPTLTDVSVLGGTGLAVGLNGTLLRLRPVADGATEIEAFDTGMLNHLLTVSMRPDGQALIGGQGVILGWSRAALAPASVGAGFDTPHSWIGGTAIMSGGTVLCVGEHGAILRGDGDGPLAPVRPAAIPMNATFQQEAAQ